MAENSLYSKDTEHASCGVGLVVSIDGSRSRKVVEHGINALKAVWHWSQVFLPRTDFGAQETCRTIVETEVLRMGYYIYGWRHVPVNVAVLGEKANATRPEIEQILISNIKGVDKETFERNLSACWRITAKSIR